MTSNNGSPSPGQQYELKKQNLASLDQETRAGLARLSDQVDTMRDEREHAMKAAATHAGNLGFVYNAETNEYVRVVSGLKEPEMPEPPPPLMLDHAQFQAAADKVEQAERDAAAELEKRLQPNTELPADTEKWYRSIPEWAIALLVGAFIGYGLGKITGLPIDQRPILLGLFLTMGAGVIVGLKMLLHKMWEEYGRSVRRSTASKWLLALFTTLTFAFCAAEAALGANALITYSRRVAFRAEDALSVWIALLIAAAISTPILLFSAFKGYGKGVRTMTAEDERIQMDAIKSEQRRVVDENLRIRKESATKQLELLQRQFEADMNAKQEAHALRLREYENECARKREDYENERREFEHHKTAPDYEALLSYVGRVNALNVQIADAEKRLSTFKMAFPSEATSKEAHRESA
ncbi:MAG: hypothetical protein M3R13_01965 [Armatimonadota bacterium]|nr:hypothetical protein [Armatimonadota bacterium]